MSKRPKTILIIGPAWVGDMVMAQSLFIALKQNLPDCQIDVVAPHWSLPLLERMPEVHHSIGVQTKHGEFSLFTRFKLGLDLQTQNYDQAIVLPNSWKSALVPFFARIPRRTGYVGEMRWGLLNDVHTLDKNLLKMTVQRFVALAYPKQLSAAPDFSIPQLRATEANKASVAKKFGLNKQPLLALCPGAEYGPAKRWPAGYFATVAKAKHQQGWQVCLMGSEKDEEICTELNALSGGICLNLAGKTQLFEAIDVLAQAEVVVSNDSGLMHIAAALDRRLIAIYGSSDPGFTPPLHAKATILQLRFSCSPCFKRECPLVHMDCLNKLTPAQVLAAIDA